MEKESKESRIGAIENVVKQMNAEENTAAVEKLHEVIFGNKIGAEEAIKALEDFAGSDDEEINARLSKLSMAELRDIARVLLVSPGKKKEDAAAAIWEFIQTPKDSGKKPRAKRAKKEEAEKKPKKKKEEEEEEEEEEDGKKKKRAKKEKKPVDPEAPKRPPTAYFIFSAEKRAQFKKELEDEAEGNKVSVADVAKKLGAAWKGMSEEEKQPYQDQAKEKMAEYKEAVKEYEESGKKAAWEAKIAEDGGEEEKPKKKAAPKKAAPKKKKEEEEEEEEEEKAEPGLPSKAELEAQIQKIVDSSNSGEKISLKSIRGKLEEHFGRPLGQMKADIRKYVRHLLQLDNEGGGDE